MKIISVKKVDESIYELAYKTYFGKTKIVKIFPFLYNMRYCHNGKNLPYNIDVSVRNMISNLNLNETKLL